MVDSGITKIEGGAGKMHRSIYDDFTDRTFTIKEARKTNDLGDEIAPVDSNFRVSTMVTYYDTGLLELRVTLYMPGNDIPNISLGKGTYAHVSAKKLLKMEQYIEEKSITEKTPENLKKGADRLAWTSTQLATSMGVVSYEKALDFRNTLYSKVNETIEELIVG